MRYTIKEEIVKNIGESMKKKLKTILILLLFCFNGLSAEIKNSAEENNSLQANSQIQQKFKDLVQKTNFDIKPFSIVFSEEERDGKNLNIQSDGKFSKDYSIKKGDIQILVNYSNCVSFEPSLPVNGCGEYKIFVYEKKHVYKFVISNTLDYKRKSAVLESLPQYMKFDGKKGAYYWNSEAAFESFYKDLASNKSSFPEYILKFQSVYERLFDEIIFIIERTTAFENHDHLDFFINGEAFQLNLTKDVIPFRSKGNYYLLEENFYSKAAENKKVLLRYYSETKKSFYESLERDWRSYDKMPEFDELFDLIKNQKFWKDYQIQEVIIKDDYFCLVNFNTYNRFTRTKKYEASPIGMYQIQVYCKDFIYYFVLEDGFANVSMENQLWVDFCEELSDYLKIERIDYGSDFDIVGWGDAYCWLDGSTWKTFYDDMKNKKSTLPEYVLNFQKAYEELLPEIIRCFDRYYENENNSSNLSFK